MELTLEQMAIVDARENIQVKSIAGAGLTFTLCELVQRHEDKKVLYITTNRKDRRILSAHFKAKHLRHVQVETCCSLTRKKLGFKVSNILQRPLAPSEILSILEIRSSDIVKDLRIAHLVTKLLQYYCNSPLRHLSEVKFERTLYDNDELTFYWKHVAQISKSAHKLLELMEQLAIPMLPEFCLKLYERYAAKINYDMIVVDGAHEIPSGFSRTMAMQKAQQIIGGDPHLHQFRAGHMNNLLSDCYYPEKTLYHSFTADQDVADQARMVLGMKKHLYENFEVPSMTGSWQGNEIDTIGIIGKEYHTVLKTAMSFMSQAHITGSSHFEGGFKKYLSTNEGVSIYDILYLYTGERSQIKSEFIRSLSHLEELEEFAILANAKDYLGLIDIVKTHRKGLPKLVKELKKTLVKKKGSADFIYAALAETRHQTYDQVNLLEDFTTFGQINAATSGRQHIDYASLEKSINQLYEASTRARVKLHLPEEYSPDMPNEANVEYERVEINSTDHINLSGKESSAEKREKVYTLSQKKKVHKNLFSRWTSEEEANLKSLQNQATSVDDISKQLKRTKSSVTSRLRKLDDQ